MAKLTLTKFDTSGIQNYIFNSNRLQENIGVLGCSNHEGET